MCLEPGAEETNHAIEEILSAEEENESRVLVL
jgi:hypothetical protein